MKRLDRGIFVHRLLFVLPAFALFAIFTYYPFFFGLYYSFTQWDGMAPPVFVGMKNYVDLFQDTAIIEASKNTLYFVLLNIFIGNPLALGLALALNRRFRTRGLLRTLFYIPSIMSLMVVAVIWSDLLRYDGLLNGFLTSVGYESWVRDWLFAKESALPMIMLIVIWQGSGFGAVIYLAGLQGISKEVYEAAEIDGASGLRKLLRITVPLLMPIVTINVFVGLVGSLKMFDLPFTLTNGGPGNATATIGLLIYKLGFVIKTLGYANAAGIMFMIVIAIITFIQVRITRSKEVEL
ncbi:carbohydrate ABC transporter permease [Cohnella silvisoli]|uniref:Sugar ABC transporter permease n=1 Tax=Cohnella silvisoli TaxID=2873699 RepID=A0ABV1KXM0_9BACL|nr:sugar ABC transporter permease [Cohnella silvisoli]MCD9023735.1 sugar ABC transporter permease [Cohnella silvisoli]